MELLYKVQYLFSLQIFQFNLGEIFNSNAYYLFKDKVQTALFKDPVRTAL